MLKSVLVLVGLVIAIAVIAPEFLTRLAESNPPAASVLTEERSTAARADHGGTVRLRADRNGHYFTKIEANNRMIDALVDTGATAVALRYEDARALGVVVPGDDFDVPLRTANGEGRARRVKLRSVTIGTITVRDVDALVLEQGALGTNLLGMSFLNRLARFEIQRGQLVLER